MPPKKPGAGLASAKKRPHEAPTKGRRAFAGTRQKVPRAGGAAADRFAAAKSAGGSVRGDGRDGDDADGDDMMDGALDVDDDGARGRKDEDDSGDDSDDEVKETADEKRLRLAKSYLEKLRAEEEEAGGDDSEDDDDDADARNLDSHDRLSNRLKNEAMQSYGRVRREVARRLVHDADDDDADDDRRGATWRGHKRAVTGVALTEDDATAFSVSKDGALVRWDVETGNKDAFPRAPPVTLGIDGGGGGPQSPPRCGAHTLLCVAASSERNLVCAAGTDKRVHVWDTRSMKHVQAFASHRGSVTSLAIRQGTGQLFSASADKTLKVWSLDDMAYVDTLFGHQSDVVAVHSQRRERVVTVGRDRTCRFWKVAEDSQLIFRPSPGDGHLESCAFTSPDTWITGSDDGTVSLWSTTKKRAVMSWRGVHGFGGGVDGEGEHGVEGPKFFTEEETAAAAKARADAQSLCGVSSLTANAPSGVSNAGRWVNAVAVGKGTDVCASGAGDGAIRLWRVCDDPGRQLVPLWCLPARGFVNSLAIASSGRFVLAGMGQEPRGGRWARDAGAKNGLLLHRLKLED